MDIEEYFKSRLVEIKNDRNVSQLFARADKKGCEKSLQSDGTLIHNQAVMSYYNMAKILLKQECMLMMMFQN